MWVYCIHLSFVSYSYLSSYKELSFSIFTRKEFKYSKKWTKCKDKQIKDIGKKKKILQYKFSYSIAWFLCKTSVQFNFFFSLTSLLNIRPKKEFKMLEAINKTYLDSGTCSCNSGTKRYSWLIRGGQSLQDETQVFLIKY